MKLCIPVKFPEGLDSQIEPHLPHAAFLAFFDTETRSVDAVSLREPKPGDERHMNFDAVLCGSISRVVLRTLAMQGVQVFGTAAQTVAEAVAQFENGELAAADAEAEGHQCSGQGNCGGNGGCGGGCHGHGEGHEAHGHEHGHGGCGGQGGCGGYGHHHDHEHGHHHHAGDQADGGCGCGGHADHHGERPAFKPLGDEFSIAVCSQNRKTVTDHAGKCRKFWVYRIQGGQVVEKKLLELPIEQSFHETPAGEAHPLDGVHALIAGSMGGGLKQRLVQHGIRGLVTDMQDPDEVVAVFLERVFGIARPGRA
ncbi:MAG: NifB/NifX family molybdenum-iron cluster-binding protein [Propionivibrio sp.]